MLITRLSRRYAKSLLDFAKEMDKVEEVKKDVNYILDVIEQSREFEVMLRSPVISPDRKEKVFDAVFAGKMGEITSKFCKIIIRKGREAELEAISRAFVERYRVMKGIEEAVITTAVPLSDVRREEIRAKLHSLTGKEIEVKEKVDPSLIGGLKVRVGDRQYNGSIATQLDQLRRKFEKNVFVAEL